ncbi:MAG: hypothetical protein AABW99_03675, partial [archaeon]
IKGTNFFLIGEEDDIMCIADIPTQTLEVNIEGKYKAVLNIGAECNKEKLADARAIIDKIEELTGQ